MKNLSIISSLFFITTILSAQTILKPDLYSKDGYCIVNTQKQKYIGLTRFKTNLQFIKQCNGKMYFIYKKDECRYFTMKHMSFDIYIKDKNEKSLFKIGQTKKVCGKTIIEESISIN